MYQKFLILANEHTFNDFLGQNAVWIAVGCAGLVAVVLAIVLIVHFKGKKKAPKKAEVTISKADSLNILGGSDNLVDSKIQGRRISVILKNYDLINKEELSKIGVDNFIMMSDRLILVFKENPEEIYNKLFR